VAAYSNYSVTSAIHRAAQELGINWLSNPLGAPRLSPPERTSARVRFCLREAFLKLLSEALASPCLAIDDGINPPAGALEPLEWVAAEIDRCEHSTGKRQLLDLLVAAGGSSRAEQVWSAFTSPDIHGGCWQ
jgi:hypothetical protein